MLCVVRLVTNLSESQNIDNHISTLTGLLEAEGWLSPHSKHSISVSSIYEWTLSTDSNCWRSRGTDHTDEIYRPHSTMARLPKCILGVFKNCRIQQGSTPKCPKMTTVCAVRIIYQNQAMRTGWDPTVTWSNRRQISFELWNQLLKTIFNCKLWNRWSAYSSTTPVIFLLFHFSERYSKPIPISPECRHSPIF